LEQTGEYGLAALQLGHHRGKGGKGGSSELSPNPDRVQARQCGHTIILPPDLVSPQRRNPVIVGRLGAALCRRRQERPVESSRSSRARATAEERSRAPSLE
jgi:hypothetical protein